MRVGLVGIAGVGRDFGRAVTRDQAAGGMVEADQLQGAVVTRSRGSRAGPTVAAQDVPRLWCRAVGAPAD